MTMFYISLFTRIYKTQDFVCFMDDSIQKRLQHIKESVAKHCAAAGRSQQSVRIIAVTKTHPASVVQEVIDAGVVDIGENRVQEIEQKVPVLSGRFSMHLIGHLQKNKVNKVVPLVDWIQSVDSEKLLEKIEAACQRLEKPIRALVQVNTTGEETKSGIDPNQTIELCEKTAQCKWVRFCGLMTIGPLGGDEKHVREAFGLLRGLGEKCSGLTDKLELSMGMSGDFGWAIEEGATMIRVGSALVGQR